MPSWAEHACGIVQNVVSALQSFKLQNQPLQAPPPVTKLYRQEGFGSGFHGASKAMNNLNVIRHMHAQSWCALTHPSSQLRIAARQRIEQVGAGDHAHHPLAVIHDGDAVNLVLQGGGDQGCAEACDRSASWHSHRAREAPGRSVELASQHNDHVCSPPSTLTHHTTPIPAP